MPNPSSFIAGRVMARHSIWGARQGAEIDSERVKKTRRQERVKEKRREKGEYHNGFSKSTARSARCKILSIQSQNRRVYIHPKVLGAKVSSQYSK
jgi:hypothetical protein